MKKVYVFLIAILFSVTAFAQVGPITGAFSICETYMTTLSCTPAGGTWSSTNPTVASIGSSNGVVMGNSAGVVTITYSMGSMGFATASFTVNPLPATITCPTSGCNVCLGSTIVVTDPTPGGIWSTQTPAIATVGSSSGLVTGVSLGTTVLSYALVPTGCFVTSLITVFPNPSAITGPTTVCVGNSITLSATPPPGTPPGTWSSSPLTVATINSGTGVLTGVSAGVASVTYMLATGCYSVYSVTVNPTPGPISCSSSTGMCSVCVGSTLALTCPPTGGVWSSSNTSVATVGSSSGIVTGVSAGVVTIAYTLSTGCATSITLTVNPSPGPISGPTTVCTGSSIILTCSPGGGTWSSSPITVATVTGTGVVTGVSAGVATITYMLSGGCFSIYTVTVNPTPPPISCASTTGSCSVCVGSTLPLFNAMAGGVWSSSNTGIATIGSSSGIITGVSPGVVTIAYTMPTGCFVTTTITVNPNPTAITGTLSVCTGLTTTLSSSPGGGSWSSSNTTVATVTGTGIVSGVSAGTSIITYMLSTGCYVTAVVTVNQTPTISGSSGTIGLSVCVGNTIAAIGTPTGGIWSSGNTGIATIGSSSGIITGIAPGITTITYVFGPCSATTTVTVFPNPTAITGTTTVCTGSSTTLSSSPGGGSWSSSNTSVATVSGTGVVTGVSAGTSVITYMLSTGCFTTTTVTVYPTPTITGSAGTIGLQVCVGSTITAIGTPTGGVWSSGNTGIATIGASSGIITGITPGVTTITYVLGLCSATTTVTVYPNPTAITGITTVCVGSTTTLSSTPGGGSWSSGNPSIATVSLTGVVTGVSAGTAIITYMLSTGCFITTTVTVNPLPSISGNYFTCVGSTTTLTGLPSGGTFTSGNPTVGTVGASSGIVTGISPGTTPITYTISTGCSITIIVTVTPAPGPIACPSLGCQVCVGSTVLVTNPIPGGTWSSSNTSIATVGSSSGIVSGVSVGTSYITYTLGGCFVVTLFTVNPVPIAYNVTGGGSYCAGGTGVIVGLSNSQIGVNYQLYCGLTPIGPAVAGTGSAISFGLQTGACTYTVVGTNAFGCTTNMTGSATVTINPMPLPITCPISGCSLCIGNTITLTSPTPGGTWSSSNTTIATIGSTTGVVTGVSAGTTIITYMLPGGCYVTTAVTVNPNPCTNAVIDPNAVVNVAIFPNPAHDEITIQMSEGAYSSFSITNNIGQVVMQKPLTNGETTINIKSLPTAIYQITFRGESGIAVKRFVKN